MCRASSGSQKEELPVLPLEEVCVCMCVCVRARAPSKRRGQEEEEVQTATTSHTHKCPVSETDFCAIDRQDGEARRVLFLQ